MSENLLRALQTFKLDQHHEKIYADPNELIEAGVPASFLLPLIRCFESGTNYGYHWEGKFVDGLIYQSSLACLCHSRLSGCAVRNWLPIHGARVRDGSKNRRDHRVVDCSIASAIAADGEGALTMGRHV